MRRSHSVTGPQITIAVSPTTAVAWVQSTARSFARAHELSIEDEWSLAVAASEAATNIMKFATSGVITLRILPAPPTLELVAEDDGPGLGDVDCAVRDGVSEGAVLAELEPRRDRRGLGTGLGAIARVMGTLSVEQSAGGGARISARRALTSLPRRS
jgi:serine/threonine-protein kinase RsbT